LGNQLRNEQTPADKAMDDHNNRIAIEIGRKAKDWADVVRMAREKMIDSAKFGGDGKAGRALWHKKAPSGWETGLTGRKVGPNLKGGTDETYEMPKPPSQPKQPGPRSPSGPETLGPPGMSAIESEIRNAPEGVAEILRKPVEQVTEPEIDRVIAEKTSMTGNDRDFEPANEMVTAWFRRAYDGASPGPGKTKPAPALAPGGGTVSDGALGVAREALTRPGGNGVADLQDALNRADRNAVPPLAVDDDFGPVTAGRLRETVARTGTRPILEMLA